MIWLTWRQHRRQLLATLAGLVALAAAFVPTGIAMRHAFDRLGLPACVSAATLPEGCGAKLNEFSDEYTNLAFLGILLLILPALVGIFWGAPMVAREVEQGTHRMVWTQGVSRRRWALTKVGLIGTTVVLVSIGYGLGSAWWYDPLSRVDSDQSRFTSLFFDMQGVAPVGYTLFAVALGIAAGTLIPRTIPAMGITLAGFVAVRVAVEAIARPRFMAAKTLTFPVASGPGSEGGTAAPGSWIMSSTVRQADGTFIATGSMRCPVQASGGCSNQAAKEFGVRAGAYNQVMYQPADRFWAFQWIETGIFVLLAALLLVWTFRRLRRLA